MRGGDCAPEDCDCPPGPQGSQGPRGATGATGEAGTFTPQYGYLVRTTATVIPDNGDVEFTSSDIASPGVNLIGGSGPNVQIVDPGVYELHFLVDVNEQNQFGITVNGAVLAFGIYGQELINAQNAGRLILAVNAGAILTLRNLSGGAVALQATAGGANPSITASLLIVKLADA